MEELLNFAKGPFFRFAFAVMALGLIRALVLSIINGAEAKGKASDKQIPGAYVKKMTLGYVLPIRSFRTKPVYSVVSILFHIGLLLTPLLLFDHALLFDRSSGISWVGISLPKNIADILTMLTIAMGIVLLIMRASNKASRFISRKQDFAWPLLLLAPFVTGFICANASVTPGAYNFFMLVHIISGNIIFILIPFTKIAHCVLLPLGQWITARSWKFYPQGPANVEKILGKEGQKL